MSRVIAPILVFVLSCVPPAPPPAATRDASAGAEAQAGTCASACANLALHSCEEAAQEDGGASCVDACLAGVAGGIPLHLDCMTSQKSVAGLRSCGVRCWSGQ